jgi:putative hydrolase of the HAD superfamily
VEYDGILFDFGNTLVPWGDAESMRLLDAIAPLFEPAEGFVARAAAARDALIREHEKTDLREATVEEFVTALCNGNSATGLVDAVSQRFHEAFVEICTVPEGLRELLDDLGRHRPLAVLSNFVLTRPVEEALERGGIADAFVHIEVSATSGFMKPHPEPFEIAVEAMGIEKERTLMVGDNFFADVVGGYRAGLLTALTHQYREGPTSDPRTPEVRADRVLNSLDELRA